MEAAWILKGREQHRKIRWSAEENKTIKSVFGRSIKVSNFAVFLVLNSCSLADVRVL